MLQQYALCTVNKKITWEGAFNFCWSISKYV